MTTSAASSRLETTWRIRIGCLTHSKRRNRPITRRSPLASLEGTTSTAQSGVDDDLIECGDCGEQQGIDDVFTYAAQLKRQKEAELAARPRTLRVGEARPRSGLAGVCDPGLMRQTVAGSTSHHIEVSGGRPDSMSSRPGSNGRRPGEGLMGARSLPEVGSRNDVAGAYG